MKHRAGGTLFLASMLAACVGQRESRVPDHPNVRSHTLFRLSVQSSRGPQPDSGTAFLAEIEGRPVALTAYHVVQFMTAEGRAKVPANVWQVASSLHLDTTDRDRHIVLTSYDASPRNVLPTSVINAAIAAAGNHADVAALLVPPGDRGNTLSLAARPAEVGDTVWLYAQLHAAPGRGLFHAATVVAVDSGFVCYAYHENLRPSDSVMHARRRELETDTSLAPDVRAGLLQNLRSFHVAFTSGSPVLNRAGEVVALHTRACPVAALRTSRPRSSMTSTESGLIAAGIPIDSVRAFLAPRLAAATSGRP